MPLPDEIVTTMPYLYKVKTIETYNKCLETAYCLFAEKGPNGFSVKELAQKCGLPRTNFYYYFKNKEELIEEVIDLHFHTTVKIFNVELTKRLHSLIPDLYLVIFDFKPGMQFAYQLFINRHNPKLNEAYKKGIMLSADLILPKFKEQLNTELPYNELLPLYLMVNDSWFSRLNFHDYSVESLVKSCKDIIDCITPLTQRLENK